MYFESNRNLARLLGTFETDLNTPVLAFYRWPL